MRKKMKTALLLMLITVLVLVTAACGANEGTNGDNKEPENSGEVASSTPPEKSESDTPVNIKIMAKHSSPQLSDSDKKFVEAIENLNNVKLELEIPPATGYDERLQLMLASGEYPDLIFFSNTMDPSFRNAVKDNIIIPVNEYVKSAKNLNDYTYPASWDELKINLDDQIYGIPRTSVVRNDGYFVRKDWLDQIGFELPANSEVTIEQFEEILRKFTLEDPDNNGKNDTYGYGGGHNASKVLEVVTPGSFGLTGWQETANGEYPFMNPVYDSESAAFKDALAFTANLYTSGYFDPDAAINDGTQRKERFWRGLTGVTPDFAGNYITYLQEIQKNTPEAELAYLFVQDKEGKVKGGSLATSSTGLWGFWAITKNAKDPQKIVNMLDSWISDEMWTIAVEGYEGHDYNLVDGAKVSAKPAPTNFIRRNTMRRANDLNFFFPIDMNKEAKDLVSPWLEKAIATVVPAKDNAFKPAATKSPNYIDYQTLWDQTTMKIIMGVEPVAKFDELLEGWYTNGGQEYVKEMNDYISKLGTK